MSERDVMREALTDSFVSLTEELNEMRAENTKLRASLEKLAPKDWDETLGISWYVWSEARGALGDEE